MNRKMSDCEEIRGLLALYVAAALDEESELRVEQHARECDACRAAMEEWHGVARELRGLPTPQPSAEIVERAQHGAMHAFVEERESRNHRHIFVLVVALAWIMTLIEWPIVKLLVERWPQWLAIPAPNAWLLFVFVTAASWAADAVAAVVLARQQRPEGRFA